MNSITEKIEKLLALSQSPNENEAKSALLKASELMAKYKIEEQDIQKTNPENVIEKMVGITYTMMTDQWVLALANIIAEHYCCKAFFSRCPKGKRMEIGFIGLNKDYSICVTAFRYAYDFVKYHCKMLRKEHRTQDTDGKTVRIRCNSYGWGFCSGLMEYFERQQQENPQWALTMIVPVPVLQHIDNMKSTKRKCSSIKLDQEYYHCGYRDGLSRGVPTNDPSLISKE